MKRSEINQALSEAVDICQEMNFKLPPFAFWSPGEWETKGHDYDEIRDNGLGWDVTDIGSGDFRKIGLTLFTLRNGNIHNKKYGKPYGEKLLIIGENQVTPYHFHWSKMEDIINRGGGELLLQLYNATDHEELGDTPVTVLTDGRRYTVDAGSIVTLRPGESITLTQGLYHKFWAEKGPVMAIEVSAVNDDHTDNRFLGGLPRFPKIIEDETPLYLLCNEYPPARD